MRKPRRENGSRRYLSVPPDYVIFAISLPFKARANRVIITPQLRRGLVLNTGALGEIRTPDPQIRSLMLYPAELRALAGRDRWAESRGGAGGGDHIAQIVPALPCAHIPRARSPAAASPAFRERQVETWSLRVAREPSPAGDSVIADDREYGSTEPRNIRRTRLLAINRYRGSARFRARDVWKGKRSVSHSFRLS
jgi:hypothetical protein